MAKNGNRTKRRTVLVLLLASVFAPILLYRDRLAGFKDPIPNSDFTEDGSNLISRSEFGTLNAIQQDQVDVVNEPIWIAYPDNSTNSSIKSKDLPHGSSGEHKSRVLSATIEGIQSENDATNEKSNAELNDRETQNTGNGEKHKREGIIVKMVNLEGKSDGLDKAQEMTFPLKQVNNEEKPTEQKLSTDDKLSKDEKPSSETLPLGTRSTVTSSTRTSTTTTTTTQDGMVWHMRDQLIRAKVYLGLGSSRSHPSFIRELRVRIRDIQRVLGDATKDSDLPKNVREKLKAMEKTLGKGRQIQENCSGAIKKLRAMLHSTEEQLRAHKKQTTFLSQVAAKTVPKGLHCLPLRLTTEFYLTETSRQGPKSNFQKLEDNSLYHYALFSDNVLAAAVVVNSTVFHAKNPEKHVFHIVTDRLNHAAMQMWFISNPPGRATIQIQNIDEFKWLNSSYSPVLKQLESQSMIDYYFKTHRSGSVDNNLKYRNPKYLSILNHLRFYLPEMYPNLEKILFLDDDVAVQKDLSALWSVDMRGKVIGAVETCGESFHRFDRYLNFSNPIIAKNFDPRACGWAFGMNLFDLVEWRKHNITDVYHSWQKLNQDRLLWKLGTLPAGLATFWNHTLVLDRTWHLLGLGYNPNIEQKDIHRAAVIHYNGNLKPWLEIGLPKYRNYWSKYVDYDQVYLRECNINH